jgi:pSer/pThr/pTyr-binding forkhead associated (FHA) protein
MSEKNLLHLVGTDGSRYYRWPLSSGSYTIGRTEGCDCFIPDKTVSRNHAELTVPEFGQECSLTDQGSHNGTMVNNHRVSGTVMVKAGDDIMFGQTEFRLTVGDEKVQTTQSSSVTTRLAEQDPEKSVFLSINEVLEPLPSKVTEREDLFPTLFEMAKLLGLSEPREVMLEKSLELVSRIVPAERLAVLFTSDDSDEIYTGATLLPGGKDPGTFTLSKTIIRDILENKRAILIGNVSDDSRFGKQESIISMRGKFSAFCMSTAAIPATSTTTIIFGFWERSAT